VYVAATRAMKRLIVYPALARLHSGHGRWSGVPGGSARRGGPDPVAVLRPLRLPPAADGGGVGGGGGFGGGGGGGGGVGGGGGGGGGLPDPRQVAFPNADFGDEPNPYGEANPYLSPIAGPTECLGCRRPAREAAAAAHAHGGGGRAYSWRDAGGGGDDAEAGTLGLAVLARRDPCRARDAATLGFHQSTTGQWWGTSEDLWEDGAREAHAAYEAEVPLWGCTS
jgi:hypothetical protein